MATEGKAVTFNAAGLSNATKNNLGLNGKEANITAMIVKGEIVDTMQKDIVSKVAGLNRAEGNKIITPSVHSNVTNIGRVKNHLMGAVKQSFEMYKQQKIEEYKNK